MIRIPAIALLLALSATPSLGAVKPMPGLADARIRTVRYDPDEVIELQATMGYQLTVEFAEGERIENVSIGDSLSWQITPNRRADLLFLKPLSVDSRTNMAVITNLRRYNFALSARAKTAKEREVVYGLRFDVPVNAVAVATPPPPPEPPRDVNHDYVYSGSGVGPPSRVFDDGRATYFAFGPEVELPAIFVVDLAGTEALSNVSYRDGFLVIDEIAPKFALRRGTAVTWITNRAHRLPDVGVMAPRRATKGER